MERSKPPGGSRSSKSKMVHGSELFALGKYAGSTAPTSDRKRESTSSITSVTKKPKIGGIIGNVPRLSGEGSSSSSSVLEPWEHMSIECESQDLVISVFNAIEQQDSDTIVGLICGGIKTVSTARNKNDSILSLSLLYLAKLRPTLFCNDIVTSALISILKRENHITAGSSSFKGRSNSSAFVLATNLLTRGYHDKKSWPEMFLRAYIDDAANERLWVDNGDCAPFVENISTAFKTRIPPKSMLQPELNAGTPTNRDSLTIDDDSGDNSLHADSLKSNDLDYNVQDRYGSSSHIVEKYVLDTIKEQFNRRQQQDCSTRNFLRFLSTTSGLSEVRALSITRLEVWIHNGKLMKPAQELLIYICYNVTGLSPKDNEVLATLVKMRLKTKPLINIYMSCLKEMITLQPDILYIVLKYVVQNELSNARNPNNMGMLANMFQTKPEQAAKHLAEIYQEFLLQREDCLRTLRVFLRELVKILRYEINLVEFCKSFLTNRPDLTTQIQQFEFKDRYFHSMVDITCLCMFLTVSPQVREANVSLRAGRDMRSNPILLAFYAQMSKIHSDTLTWIYQDVPRLFAPQATDYTQSLHKILLLDSAEQYSRCDQWPTEPERVAILRLVSETPVHQDSLLKIILIGISKEIPFTIPDTYDVIEHTIKRASALKCIDYPAVEADKVEIIDFLFSMAEYHHPENIVLPTGYEPPKLAITALYWKAWVILLMLSSHNPGTFGAYCWEHYSILRMFMEMCITNQFHDIKLPEEELQIVALEEQQILEFETHLAAATSKVVITEQNSLLLSQLTLMDPMGSPRRPPVYIVDILQQLNSNYKFGHLLCRSRKPDLLLDIINRHGSTQSMPWLSDLVQNSDGDFNHLPVQCLCEFLLSNSANLNIENVRDAELLEYLRNLLRDENADKQTSCEVLEYFLRRLASTCKLSRILATNGLKLLLQTFKKPDEVEDPTVDWLLRYLPEVPHFVHARPIIILQLRAACQIENNPELVMIYIQFIAAHTLHDPVPEMLDHVMDMSQLIVERSTIFQHIIPVDFSTLAMMKPDEAEEQNRLQTLNCLFVMFNNYLIKLREHEPPYEWADYPDLLSVHFDDGMKILIHLNIIHAFIILLTNSTETLPNSIPILDYWFPPGSSIPQAFTIDTNEPVSFLPDWLKLKMIRSPVERLVEVAMFGLTPDQIVLFVQNFGTPISSMSKLLALLDHAVIEQFDAVKNAILNKAYLAQLIEIQQARGAKNGHVTVQALELHEQSQPDLPKNDICVLDSINLDNFQPTHSEKSLLSIKPSKEVEEVVDLILKASTLSKVNSLRFRKLIHQLIGRTEPPPSTTKRSRQQDTQALISGKVLLYLMRLAESYHGPQIFRNIVQKSHACTFFRALLQHIPEKQENYNFMLEVVDKIIYHLNRSDNIELLQILQNKKKSFVRQIVDTSKVQSEKEDVMQVLKTSKIAELESKGKKFVNDMIEHKNSEELVEAMISVLNNTPVKSGHSSFKVELDWLAEIDSELINSNVPASKLEHSSDAVDLDKKGILVDWLAEVDSELITINKKLQMHLLFGSNISEFRFYMLSLLCHQANWATLDETLTYLLMEFRSNYDCSTVLNFIEALIQNPKLWQGRDKAIPKHEQIEYIVILNMDQAKVFTEYTLNESILEKDIELKNEKISSRVNLLLKICNENYFNFLELVHFVRNYSSIDQNKQKFLQHLYLMVPTIRFVDENLNDEMYTSNVQDLKGCRADKITNYIITTLASLQTQKDHQAMSSDTELLIRKLAASHPSLFLRQLSVLSSLLQGKAHMSLNVLRSEYHMSRFHQVIRILELLEPLVFDDAYKNALQLALDSYFTFFKHHTKAKEAYPILLKFVELLQGYINKNPSTALTYIEQYTGLLQELTQKFRAYIPLHQLVQGLSLLKHKTIGSEITEEEIKQEFEIDEDQKPVIPMEIDPSNDGVDIDSKGAASFALGGPSKQMQISPHFRNLVNIIQHSSSEDVILQPLQDIDSLTFKRSGYLDELYERLLELIFSQSAQVRSNAYILLVRHLKHNPGNKSVNKSAVTAYIQCLRDDDSTIATSAIDNLIEMVICLQEYASEILRTVFDLGIQSRLNTSSQIKKCLQTLKLQHAC